MESKKVGTSDNFERVLQKITRQSSIIFLSKISFFLSGLVSSVLLAKILGATLLGRFQLGFVIVQLISIFCILGFDQGLIRFIPIFELKDRGKIKKLIFQNVFITFTQSIVFSILLYEYSPLVAQYLFKSSHMIGVLKTFSLFLPIFILFRICSASLIGLKRADVESSIRNILTPIFFMFSLGIIFIVGGNIYEIIALKIISYILAIVCILGFIFKKHSFIFKGDSAPYNFKKYLLFSVPLLFIGLIYFLMGQIDILMLGYFLGEKQVGIYSVAVRISMFTILGLGIVNQTLAPHISELGDIKDFQALEKLLKVTTKWISYISLFVFFVIIIFRIEILEMFGFSFVEGAVALVILTTGQLANAFAGPIGKILIMTGKQKWELFNTISMLVINILLNLILIPKFGIVGAAIATAISIASINVLKLFEVYKEFKFHPYSLRYFKGIVALISGAFVAYLFQKVLNSMHLNSILIMMLSTFILLLITLLVLYFLKLDTEDKIIFDKLIQTTRSSS